MNRLLIDGFFLLALLQTASLPISLEAAASSDILEGRQGTKGLTGNQASATLDRRPSIERRQSKRQTLNVAKPLR